MFRLVEATQMGECRGSVNWLTIWRATPVREPKYHFFYLPNFSP